MGRPFSGPSTHFARYGTPHAPSLVADITDRWRTCGRSATSRSRIDLWYNVGRVPLQIRTIFVSMLVLIVVGMASIFYVGVKSTEAKAQATREAEILQKIERIVPSLNAAAGERLAYVVMWQPDYRPAYRTALKTLYRNVDSLKPDLAPEVFHTMKDLVHAQVQQLELAVDVRKSAPLKVTEIIMRQFREIHEGRDPKQPLKDELERLRKEHEARLTDARAQVVRATAVRTCTFFAISGVFVLFTGWTYTRVVREMNQRQRAMRAKDQFLAVLSHELRTPLTPVLTTAQMLEADPVLSDDHREMARTIRRNAELEARLIDDLLDLNRIARNKLDLHLTTVDAHEKVGHVLRGCRDEIAAKGLSVTADFAADAHHVRADPARFEQIVWNVLKNAVKFTPAGGRVTVRTANAGDGRIRIEVADTGIGIAPDVLPKVFDAFEQGGREITRQFGGLGLGMAITKALVGMHGGTVHAASEGTGKGARFTVEFPTVAKPHATSRAGVSESGPPLRCSVLLVEDHADTRRTMARLLGSAGCRVSTAGTVAEALEVAGCEDFDLVISDIGLPDATGADLMRQLKARHGLRGIALSGFGMDEDVAKSMEAGFSTHMTKPVDLRALLDAVRRLTAG